MTKPRPEDAPRCEGEWQETPDSEGGKMRQDWKCSLCDAESPDECCLESTDSDDDAHNDPRSGQAAGINKLNRSI